LASLISRFGNPGPPGSFQVMAPPLKPRDLHLFSSEFLGL